MCVVFCVNQICAHYCKYKMITLIGVLCRQLATCVYVVIRGDSLKIALLAEI